MNGAINNSTLLYEIMYLQGNNVTVQTQGDQKVLYI
jgi:hypothetical protein